MKLSEAIKALEDGKKIRVVHWHDSKYIILKDKRLINNYGCVFSFSYYDLTYEWELYEEPNKKVTKYLWALISLHYANITSSFYKDESEVQEDYSGSFEKILRLDWSATEFEE